MIKPYKHQKKFIKRVRRAFRKHKHILCQSATGSGKTVMFSFIAAKAAARSNRVLIITDRVELLKQSGGTIESFEMDPYYIQAGTKFIDKTKTVYIAMSQTLRNRMDVSIWRDFIKNNIGLIIIDEAHIQEFNWIFDDGFAEDIFIAGFTATPKRSGKMTQLAEQYDKLVLGEPINKLIEKGYLVNCDIYDCGKPDLSGVSMNRAKGDYSETSLYQKYNNAKLYQGLVKNYQNICPGQKAIVFCCNVEHAINTTRKLRKAGINARFICAKKTQPREPKKWNAANKEIFKDKFKAYKQYQKYYYEFSGERDEVFDWFKNSSDGVLVNVDIATKGFDDPSIEVVVLYRATTSEALYLQMIGRGGRKLKNKLHFTVLDFGGNKERFGPYDINREWSLWHEESASGGVPPMKICGEDASGEKIKGASKVKEGCERLILASYSICPFCGFKYPKKDKAKEVELALAAIVDEKGVSIKSKSFKDMSFEELTQYRKIKKYHINWLYRMLWMKDGENTIREYAKEYKWKNSRIHYVIEDCKNKY